LFKFLRKTQIILNFRLDPPPTAPLAEGT
jgi:hypothetical protein